MYTRFLSVIAAILILGSACKKDGPAGPQGAQGEQGAPGPQGQTGAQGPAGTAKVIYSDWISGSGFADSSFDGSNYKVCYVPAPEIVDSILQKGTVLMYLSFGQGNFVLPYTSYAGANASVISFIPAAGKIIITRFTLDNSRSVALATTLKYRYVIIPGGVASLGVINWKDYPTISKLYNFKD